MKTLNAFAFALLFAAGCSTYPESQSSYSASSYGTPQTSSGAQAISSPTYYDTNIVVTAPYTGYTPSQTYSSGLSQGTAASSQITEDSDRMVVNSVRQALNNSPTEAYASQRININSRNGMVTVNGTVPSEQDRQNIDAIIRTVSGVRSLDDQLQISQPTGAADTRIYSTAPVLANTAGAPGNIFNLHVQGLNEPDRTLAQRILQELRADTILPSLLPMVSITVADGRVTLEGNVQSDQQRATIESAVRRATGGNTVNDLLQVR